MVLGFSMVGKTAICQRFCNDRFSDKYEPTYETAFRKLVRRGSEEIELVVIDTQGQDEQEIFRKEYCLGAHAYLLVYSVASARSLESCVAINQKLVGLMGSVNIPRILIGNKNDLDKTRVVSHDEGAATAKKLGCKFIECSAKQNMNIGKESLGDSC